MTELKQLEQHRKEFVANVSHELRTPLTNIQGFSETLLNPSVTDFEERQKFVQIIHNHAARLGAIIDDLLMLSKVEKGSDHNEFSLEETAILPILKNVAQLCADKAKKNDVVIVTACTDNLTAAINIPLLEQALINLLDNAIKYGARNSDVLLNAEYGNGVIQISVTDQGSGIAPEHLERLFERFYRVDKARSRDIGGTGLGLSIVKHIALTHGGNVSVESELGKGSKFIFSLPIKNPS